MDSIRTPILTEGDEESKRVEVREYFNRTYDLYERLFECLVDDAAYYARPEPLRHPLIFYYGHPAVFYVNKLRDAGLLPAPVDDALETMLAVGVDEMSWDDLNEDHYDWPAVATLRGYREVVRAAVNRIIDTAPLVIPVGWDHPFWMIMMGIEHDRIHLETSSVLMRQLAVGHVRISSAWPRCGDTDRPASENALVTVDGGRVELGRALPAETYGWDNEFGASEIDVAPFRTSRSLVSHREYLAFVKDDGYLNEQWWSSEGWQWRSFKEAVCPPFWIADEARESGFRFRTLGEELDLPLAWPAEVNYHEADAYCRWLAMKDERGIRLPTEAEWRRMYDVTISSDYPRWRRAPGNVNLEHFASSCPVDVYAQGVLFDVVGNVWQWTSTPIAPFPGFRVHRLYDDFSVPTFDGLHNLIKGGSWISTGNEACRDSRYAFRRHFYQHAGFRYVTNMET